MIRTSRTSLTRASWALLVFCAAAVAQPEAREPDKTNTALIREFYLLANKPTDFDQKKRTELIYKIPQSFVAYSDPPTTQTLGTFVKRAETRRDIDQDFDARMGLAVLLGSRALKDDAGRLAKFYSEANLALRGQAFHTASVQRIVNEGDALAARQWDEVVANPTFLNNDPASIAIRGAQLNEYHNLLRYTHALDETDYYRRRALPASMLQQLSDLRTLVVSIQLDVRPESTDPVSRWKCIGTGFLYKGKVITCAHVITANCYDTESKKNRVERVRLFFADANGEYSLSGKDAVQINPETMKLRGRCDAALLEPVIDPASDGGKRATELIARFCAPNQTLVQYATGDEDLSVAEVYGLSALPADAGCKVFWLTPSRIVFPPRVRPPRDGGGASDSAFQRAFRTQVFGLLADPVWNQKQAAADTFERALTTAREQLLDTAVDRTLPSYATCASAYCSFEYPILPESRLDVGTPDLGNARFIECLGTDLATQPLASGSPILLFGSGVPTIIGLHSGAYGVGTERLMPPSLEQMSREVPFKRVLDALNN